MQLAKEVVALIPQFLDRPTVLGLGEIGLNKNSRNELEVLEMHIDLAARHELLILAHTPHLEDKFKGTRLTIEALKNNRRIKPERVIIDHVEEHTIEMVLEAGFWAGMTSVPGTKCTSSRAIDMIEQRGPERLGSTARAIGETALLAIPYTALEMRKRGHSPARIVPDDLSKSIRIPESVSEVQAAES